MWHGEYFWSPPEIIGVVFTYTLFYTIEKVVLCRQLTKPKVVSLSRPALLKHFKGAANHAGHMWTVVKGNPKIFFRLQALVCTKCQVISSPSNGLYTMKIINWVYRLDLKKILKKTSRHTRSLSSFLKSSDSGSFISGLAGGHLYHLCSICFRQFALK